MDTADILVLMHSKEQVHWRLVGALRSGAVLAKISEESGVPYDSLRQFRNSKALGPENVKKLADYFENHPTGQGFQRNIFDEAAVLLDNLARFIGDRNMDMLTRYEYLEAQIQAVQKMMPALKRAAENPDSPRPKGI